jgi:restriction system protein
VYCKPLVRGPDSARRPSPSMPRRNHAAKEARTKEKRQSLAFRLIAVGAAFAIAPWFFGGPIAQGFRTAWPLGVILVLLGAALLWVFSIKADRAAPALDEVANTQRTPLPDPVGDLQRQRAANADPSTKVKARIRPENWSAQALEDIEWRRFEAVVERFFGQAGFATRSQSHGADGGVDIWLMLPGNPDEPAGIVQCKQWSSKRVGVDKVRELRGVMAAHAIRRGHFVTTSGFTDEARTFAQANGIALLDAPALLAQIAQRTPAQQAELLAVALEGEYWRPTCVNCGIKLVERRPRAGGAPFWGCENFPRCRTTLPIRSTV